MIKIRKYLKILLGCILIASALNLFFIENDIFPAGIFGIATMLEAKLNIDLWLSMALLNVAFIFFAFVALPRNKCKRTVLTFALIPVLCYITRDIGSIIDVKSVDILLKTLYGGVIVGLGHRFIYKESNYASGSDVISAIEKEFTGAKLNIVNYLIDASILIMTIYLFGFEQAMYSLIAIVVIETLSKRATLGTSDSKVFYIITKKDKAVRKYIIEELGYTLTVFDVKGGFLKTKNTVLMTVIPTKDYYKLREGIKLIDAKAFISITDSYEVINGIKKIEKEK